MLILTKVNNPVYDNFKVGDKVKSLTETHFTDGTFHLKGVKYTIQVDTLSYYNIMRDYYELVSSN